MWNLKGYPLKALPWKWLAWLPEVLQLASAAGDEFTEAAAMRTCTKEGGKGLARGSRNGGHLELALPSMVCLDHTLSPGVLLLVINCTKRLLEGLVNLLGGLRDSHHQSQCDFRTLVVIAGGQEWVAIGTKHDMKWVQFLACIVCSNSLILDRWFQD